jgi:hypothetical protein
MTYTPPRLVQLGAAQSIVLGMDEIGTPDADLLSFAIELW